MTQIYIDGNSAAECAKLLKDIGRRAPKTLDIRELICRDDSGLKLCGNALSFNSIHLFGELLSQSDYIASATVTETSKDQESGEIITYTISCVLAGNEGVAANVD